MPQCATNCARQQTSAFTCPLSMRSWLIYLQIWNVVPSVIEILLCMALLSEFLSVCSPRPKNPSYTSSSPFLLEMHYTHQGNYLYQRYQSRLDSMAVVFNPVFHLQLNIQGKVSNSWSGVGTIQGSLLSSTLLYHPVPQLHGFSRPCIVVPSWDGVCCLIERPYQVSHLYSQTPLSHQSSQSQLSTS